MLSASCPSQVAKEVATAIKNTLFETLTEMER